MKYYEIADWADHFENNRSKELKETKWVPFPNKHDGIRYGRLSQHENFAEILGCWLGIVQVASKCPTRGVLANERGPLTAEDISFATRIPCSVLQKSLTVLLSPEIGWIKEKTYPAGGCGHPAGKCDHPAPPSEGGEMTTISQEGATIPQEGATRSQEGAMRCDDIENGPETPQNTQKHTDSNDPAGWCDEIAGGCGHPAGGCLEGKGREGHGMEKERTEGNGTDLPPQGGASGDPIGKIPLELPPEATGIRKPFKAPTKHQVADEFLEHHSDPDEAEDMAEAFFEKWERNFWTTREGHAIAHWKNFVPRFIREWKRNDRRKNDVWVHPGY